MKDTSKVEFVIFENVRNYKLSLNQEKIDCKIFAEMINFILVSFSSRFQVLENIKEFILYSLKCDFKLIDVKPFLE